MHKAIKELALSGKAWPITQKPRLLKCNTWLEDGDFMVRCHLARMMGEHKMNIADVARETGLNRNTVTLLYKETAQRIELDALDKLCKLFQCEVSDLLEYLPDKTE